MQESDLTPTIRLVLFDLGGVLVQLNGLPFEPEWFKDPGTTPVLHEWGISEEVQAFETGKASAEEFAAFTIKSLQLNTDPDSFISRFGDWPGPLFPGTLTTIRQLRQQVKVAIYSNTNHLHWPRIMDEMALEGEFDHYFASHLLGHAKPNPEGFEHILHDLGFDASEILFIDDNATNIATANKLGFVARQAQGLDAVKAVLKEYALLEG